MNNFLSKLDAFLDKVSDKTGSFLSNVRHSALFRFFKAIVCILIIALLVFYGAARLFVEEGAFTVSLAGGRGSDEGDDTLSAKGVISLSETADFANPTVQLKAEGIENMTNISVFSLPDDVEAGDGSHNGDNYIAYSFYVKNVGDAPCDLRAVIHIDSVLKNADAAVRVRLYKDGVPTTYAKLATTGLPEYGTVPFFAEDKVLSETTTDFQVDAVIRYTLVIWLEGDDPECLDDIKGGRVKMSMAFSLVEPDSTSS
ncbi:MAG: hypothetical protein E7639_04080 [Ruminococcaceae bacterium]|nr:hypothetical protein [Oscillospiraceae bacterium]